MTAATRRKAIVAGLLIAGFAAAFFALGGGTLLSDPAELEAWVERRGVWGPVLFVLLMWAVQPLGLPGAVFMVPAGLIWSMPVAIGLSWIGNMGASAIAFVAARRLGRDWVAGRIPPKLAKWNDRLADGGTLEIVGLRVVTGQLPPADWMLGVSSVRWRPFLIGTGIGIIPGILLVVVAGVGLVGWLADRPVLGLVALGATIVAVGIGTWRRGRA